MKNNSIYETAEKIVSAEKIQFFFESTGKKTIVKVIEYSLVDFIGGKAVFNLGFGDYDAENDSFYDDVNSNNGDIYTVFNTVLNTVPFFFKKFPDSVIIVGGSDSRQEFEEMCKPTCKKRCADACKNIDRRINIYRHFVDKYIETLSNDYVFFGYNSLINNTFTQYLPNKRYDKIIVYQKK